MSYTSKVVIYIHIIYMLLYINVDLNISTNEMIHNSIKCGKEVVNY